MSAQGISRLLEWLSVFIVVIWVSSTSTFSDKKAVSMYLLYIISTMTEWMLTMLRGESTIVQGSIKRRDGLTVGVCSIPLVFLSKVLFYQKRTQTGLYSHADELLSILVSCTPDH
jgi:hypothetical protein